MAMKQEQTRAVNFRFTVPRSTMVRLVALSPLEGRITAVTMDFPPGCNNLVDVLFGVGGGQIIPEIGYIALANATPTYPCDHPVKKDERLYVEFWNTDGGFPHTPSVIVSIVGIFPPRRES